MFWIKWCGIISVSAIRMQGKHCKHFYFCRSHQELLRRHQLPRRLYKSLTLNVVTVDVRGNITSRQRRQAQFISENLGSGAILDMVAIPGGSFVMGSPNTEARRSNNEGPQRTVNISPFFMGKYPIHSRTVGSSDGK
jgi:formylglycine-generating enzyme required for sulfatase activity